MKVTVIIYACNRDMSLAETLASLAVSAVPELVEWEVLVVDNNSTDQTRSIIEDFCRRFPGRFRYVFESQPGKSFALNSGIRAARGNILAFTDDDVIVDPAWLQNLTFPMKDTYWAGTGGRTLPSAPFSPPSWLPFNGPFNMAGIVYAGYDICYKPCESEYGPFGANMAFRKTMFEKYGDFRTDLGPSPNKSVPRPNEDCEFSRRLFSRGHHVCYVPSAIVRHPVLHDRVTRQYLLSWWFDFGRAEAREFRTWPSHLGLRNSFVTIVITLGVDIPLWIVTLSPQRRFIRKCKLWGTAGRVAEVLRLGRQGKGHEKQ